MFPHLFPLGRICLSPSSTHTPPNHFPLPYSINGVTEEQSIIPQRLSHLHEQPCDRRPRPCRPSDALPRVAVSVPFFCKESRLTLRSLPWASPPRAPATSATRTDPSLRSSPPLLSPLAARISSIFPSACQKAGPFVSAPDQSFQGGISNASSTATTTSPHLHLHHHHLVPRARPPPSTAVPRSTRPRLI
jgi:hypothetical protein